MLHEDLYTFMKIPLQILVRMRNVSDKVVVKTKTDFIFNNIFPKILPLIKQIKKVYYLQTDHRIHYNTAHALCLLDKEGYSLIVRILNSSCFSTTTAVT
jgi:hypothetical protein